MIERTIHADPNGLPPIGGTQAKANNSLEFLFRFCAMNKLQNLLCVSTKHYERGCVCVCVCLAHITSLMDRTWAGRSTRDPCQRVSLRLRSMPAELNGCRKTNLFRQPRITMANIHGGCAREKRSAPACERESALGTL